MAEHIDLGKSGEAFARKHLEDNGYEILEVNWRFQRAEVDIIAKDGAVLVFIEVKSRSTSSWGPPEQSISPKKRMLLADAASRYMELIHHEWEIRFDVISVIIHQDTLQSIEHHKDSFFPGW